MAWLDLVRWLHVLGACVLIGTGAGIAFFMVMAHRTGNAASIAHTASVVVVADMVFTATAVVLQPITGLALAWGLGWPLTEGWLVLSIALYFSIGLLWLPVVFIQIGMRNEATASVRDGTALSPRYARLYRIWFACGVPAFAAILIILWLMLTRPAIG
ncbi:MAG: DUF2269 domain-containing protein [Rhodobiaceae bacterium]|nr:DUF2269 domain-containing protein [Rhodobiaceae bacterium]